MRCVQWLFFILVCVLSVPSASLLAAPVGTSPLRVTVSIVPQAYFVQHIAGDLAQIAVMVPPGASPATYEPKPNQMKALAASALYIAVGVPFETVWLDAIRAVSPDIIVIASHEGVTKVPMARHLNDHGPQNGKPCHGASAILDPHIWLDPALVTIQARAICKGLVAVDPVHKAVYEANLAAFERKLAGLDASIRKMIGTPSTNNRFVVFHPAWGYFARAYGLEQIPVEMEGKSPSPRELSKLINMARAYGVNTVFVQPQFSQKSAGVIAQALGGKVVKLDPLARDWAANLETAAQRIKEALR